VGSLIDDGHRVTVPPSRPPSGYGPRRPMLRVEMYQDGCVVDHMVMTNSNRFRIAAASVSVAALAAVGLAVHQVNQHEESSGEARMSAIPTPCDGFADCIYTAYWYAFLR
jgi:hypothetical protein